jgi:hypothetical protein
MNFLQFSGRGRGGGWGGLDGNGVVFLI